MSTPPGMSRRGQPGDSRSLGAFMIQIKEMVI